MTGSSVSTQEAATQSLAAISNAKRIAITTHIRPDGDAVGAAVGLLHLLRDNGYQADLVGLDPIHTKYQFLTSTLTVLPPARTPGNSYNLLVVLDTGALDRAPGFVASWLPDVHLLNIDHHPTNIGFGHTNWVQAAAAAAAEMITSLAVEARWTISPAAAEALWVGITTDTGRFAYSCTTPATLEAAARLLEAGLDTQALDQRVFNTLPLPALRLQALAVHRMELHLNNQLAIIALSREDFRACQATGEDTDDIVNLPRKLDSVAVSIFLHESEPSEPAKTQPAVKASFRTLPPHDAGALCQTLGGVATHAPRAAPSPAPSMRSARISLRLSHKPGFRHEHLNTLDCNRFRAASHGLPARLHALPALPARSNVNPSMDVCRVVLSRPWPATLPYIWH